MKRKIASFALAACALLAPQWAGAQARFDSLVIFGTSLSDAGNFFALVGGTNTPPNYQVDPLLVPSVPYARGGHHFSDGETWVEQLARSLGMAASAKPALANESKKAANYAVGGARANDIATGFNLADQTTAFLRDRGNVAPSSALYVVEMGGNDIRDAIGAYLTGGPVAAQTVIQGALASIGQNIFTLWTAGARNFLVLNAPNVGRTPALLDLDLLNPGAAALATMLSQAFNAGLQGHVIPNLAALPGIELSQLDVYGQLEKIVVDPAAFGLSNVRNGCITPEAAPFHCKQVREYLFWDGIHPTAAAHSIVAQQAAAALR